MTGFQKQADVVGQNAGIARILRAGDTDAHAGMAMLLSPRRILTCAHVVNVALGRSATEREAPMEGATVLVGFPMLATRPPHKATIERWRAPGFGAQDDIAVLVLEDDAPCAVGVAVLAEVTGVDLAADALSVFGIAGGSFVGNHVDAHFMGPVSGSWAQLDGSRETGAFIQGGFSGAAVWDKQHGAIVGMVVAKSKADGVKVAYMIPTAALRGFDPSIQTETRTLPPWAGRVWLTLSLALFGLILVHFMVERGADELAALTLTAGSSQLAELWGAMIYGFLAWIPSLLLFKYAGTLSLHPWWVRLPTMRPTTALKMPATARFVGVLTIVGLILLPIYAQAHLLRQLHDSEGRVAINIRQWGYDSPDVVADKDECRGGFCTLHNLGIYNVAPAGPTGAAGYVDNAYRYGDEHLERMQSFYPLLQPALIIVGTMAAFILTLLGLVRVFRRTTSQ